MKVAVSAFVALAAFVASASGQACKNACIVAEAACETACALDIFDEPQCDIACTAVDSTCELSCVGRRLDSPTVRGGKVDAAQSHKKHVKSHSAKILEDALCGLPNHDAKRAELFCNKLKDEQK
jgi:hypothetical protein